MQIIVAKILKTEKMLFKITFNSSFFPSALNVSSSSNPKEKSLLVYLKSLKMCHFSH